MVKLTEENLIEWIREVSPVDVKLPPRYYLVSKVQPGIAGGTSDLEVEAPMSSSVSTWKVDYQKGLVEILFCCIDITDIKGRYVKEYKTFEIQVFTS